MDFLRRSEPPVLLALFTQRMLSHIARPDAPPLASVTSIDLRVTLILAIAAFSELGVLFAIPRVRELGAARVRAGCGGLAWHECRLQPGTGKPQTIRGGLGL